VGYILGRASAPSVKPDTAANLPAVAPDARPQAAPPVAAPVEENRAREEQPVQTTAQAVTPPSPEAAAQAPAEEPSTASESPVTYLQVMAVQQREAEAVMRSLKEKGFPVTLSPGPDNRVRVLVGPYGDRETLGRAKAALENIGLHPFPKR
jgi:cell division septation protein DedD